MVGIWLITAFDSKEWDNAENVWRADPVQLLGQLEQTQGP